MYLPSPLSLAFALRFFSVLVPTTLWAQEGAVERQRYLDLRRYYIGLRLGLHLPDVRIANSGQSIVWTSDTGMIVPCAALASASALSGAYPTCGSSPFSATWLTFSKRTAPTPQGFPLARFYRAIYGILISVIRGSLSLEWYDVLKSFTYLCDI